MEFDIDIAIFLAFLAVNLIVGLRYGRGVKTIKDYALGGRNFATGAIVSTIVASWVSGSGFFITLSKTYSDGLLYFIASLGMVASLAIIALIFVPRMQNFLGISSIAEVIGNIYGPYTRAIVALGGIIASIGGIAVQFKVFGSIFTYFLGLDGIIAIVTAGTIITLYSAFGGIRSVTFTDILQFITFGFALPLVGILIWQQVYYDGFNFQTALENPLFNYKELLSFENPKFLQIIPLILYFSIPQMGQIEFQRISIGRNIQQVQKAFLIAGLILIFIKLVESWIPFLMFNLNPDLDPNQLLSYIIDNYTYPGLKGLFMIGIIAMTMSCADTDMNAAAVFFGNDICKVFNIGFKRELLMSRLFALCLGIGAMVLALSKSDLLSVVLAANSFYMPVATVPCMLTILGFRTTTKSILIGMGAGLTTVIIWNILNIETDCIVFGMLANLIFLFGSHYLLKQTGGWTAIKLPNYKNAKGLNKLVRINNVDQFFRKFRFVGLCKKYSPTNQLTYMGFGIYCIFYTFTTMYSTHVELLKDNGDIILVSYQIMMITGILLAMYPIWPVSIKQEIKEMVAQVIWYIAIFYMLTFFSGFFVMVNNFGQLQFVVFTINMIIAIVLVGWKIALGMILIGFYLSIQFYKFYGGVEHLNLSIGSSQFVFIYTLIMVGTTIILFFRPKQAYEEEIEQKSNYLEHKVIDQKKELTKLYEIKNELLRNLEHETRTPITGITSLGQVLWANYDKFNEEQRRNATKDIADSSERLTSLVNNLIDLSKLNNINYQLNKSQVNLTDLVHERLELCKKLYIQDKDKDDLWFNLQIEDELTVLCDEYYISRTIDNIIVNAIQYCKQGTITIELKPEQSNTILFSVKDEGIGIPKDELFEVFDPFTVSSKTKTPAGGRGIGLALSKKVIEAHNGQIWAKPNQDKGVTVAFSLPIND